MAVSPAPGKPSLATIAAELGVSQASVSNALNKPDRVSAELRERVLTTATRLGYAGAAAARRRLPGGTARSAGIVFTGDLASALHNPAATLFLEGVARSLDLVRTSLLLLCADDPANGGMAASIRDAVVDGFILFSVRGNDPLIEAVRARHLPMVVVDSPKNLFGVSFVGGDDLDATRQLGAYLAGLGHRAVAVIAAQLNDGLHSGPATADRWRDSSYDVMRDRLTGLASGLRVGADDLIIDERFENSPASGADSLHALLDRHPRVTAVVCLTDELALGALQAARQRGLVVPRDLTITGFDDIPEADRAGLTTISQGHVEKGRLAGDLLHATAAPATRRYLPTALQIRSTSGPPRD